MAEVILDLRAQPKDVAWRTLDDHVRSVLSGVDDDIAAMATISALVANAFGYLWVGFYRVVREGELLRVGPYQGTLGCLEIQFGRGVCGVAAHERRTVVVEDVRAFQGHITCDARSRSEIVVPVFNRSGALIAVFDIDAEEVGAFSDVDARHLEHTLRWFAEDHAHANTTRG